MVLKKVRRECPLVSYRVELGGGVDQRGDWDLCPLWKGLEPKCQKEKMGGCAAWGHLGTP